MGFLTWIKCYKILENILWLLFRSYKSFALKYWETNKRFKHKILIHLYASIREVVFSWKIKIFSCAGPELWHSTLRHQLKCQNPHWHWVNHVYPACSIVPCWLTWENSKGVCNTCTLHPSRSLRGSIWLMALIRHYSYLGSESVNGK